MGVTVERRGVRGGSGGGFGVCGVLCDGKGVSRDAKGLWCDGQGILCEGKGMWCDRIGRFGKEQHGIAVHCDASETNIFFKQHGVGSIA